MSTPFTRSNHRRAFRHTIGSDRAKWNGRFSHPLATQIGIEILKNGGNAIDAAIAVNAALGLMEPTGCGIGGDLFAIVWDQKQKNYTA